MTIPLYTDTVPILGQDPETFSDANQSYVIYVAEELAPSINQTVTDMNNLKLDTEVAAQNAADSEQNVVSVINQAVSDATASAEQSAQNAASSNSGAASSAASSSASAELSKQYRDQAQSVQNYAGPWSSLSGSYSVGTTTKHNNRTWRLDVNLPDISLSEPGVTGDYTDITYDVSGGAERIDFSSDTSAGASKVIIANPDSEQLILTIGTDSNGDVKQIVNISSFELNLRLSDTVNRFYQLPAGKTANLLKLNDTWYVYEDTSSNTTDVLIKTGIYTVFSTNVDGAFSVCKLTDSKIAIFFADSSQSGRPSCVIGDISGFDISFGSIYNLAAGSTSISYTECAAIDVDSVIFAYKSNSAGVNYVCHAAVAGNAVSFGSPVQFESAQTVANAGMRLTAIDSTTALLSYFKITAPMACYSAIVTHAGLGVVTVGTKVQFATPTNNSSIGGINQDFVSSDTFVVTNVNDLSANDSQIVVGNIFGGNISFGTPLLLPGKFIKAIISDESNSILAVSGPASTSTSGNALETYTVSGSNITASGISEPNDDLVSYLNMDMTKLSDNSIVLSFGNNTGQYLTYITTGTSISYSDYQLITTSSTGNPVQSILGNKSVVCFRDAENSFYSTAVATEVIV